MGWDRQRATEATMVLIILESVKFIALLSNRSGLLRDNNSSDHEGNHTTQLPLSACSCRLALGLFLDVSRVSPP